jgi:hypothetical protein
MRVGLRATAPALSVPTPQVTETPMARAVPVAVETAPTTQNASVDQPRAHADQFSEWLKKFSSRLN